MCEAPESISKNRVKLLSSRKKKTHLFHVAFKITWFQHRIDLRVNFGPTQPVLRKFAQQPLFTDNKLALVTLVTPCGGFSSSSHLLYSPFCFVSLS